jgi:hypothetical protein
MQREWNDGEVKPQTSGSYPRDTSRFGERYPKVTRYFYSCQHKAWFEKSDLKVISGWQNLPWRVK